MSSLGIETSIDTPYAGEQINRVALSWGAVIGGTIAATAVAFLIIALGSGIGFSLSLPYSGPSATTLTAAAAVWLVLAEALAFATGGYLAARLRSPLQDLAPGDTTFRDAAHGLVVWALGVVVMAAVAGMVSLFAAGAAAHVSAGAAAGMVGSSGGQSGQTTSSASPVDYFVDLMLRPRSITQAASAGSETTGSGSGSSAPLNRETRAEVTRVVMHAASQGKLDDTDRSYLAQLVAMRSGLPQDQAEQRVTQVEDQARTALQTAKEKTEKAGAMSSFWTFMALLFGAVAAALAGILGGQLRDADLRQSAA
ncbi:MAG TPA: hypothetical protein VFB45_10280 [Pseudolabrys sp.]|nr:hypothetical protein [Pseudolabrys sp.]